ncbi:MAG: hypothetical protein J6S51_05180 [Kiritimatiellae bacterium]|nr:hypothetical protein [Kiritimatiellia bacterium]
MKITRLPKKKKPKNKIILDRYALAMIKASKSDIVDRYCREFESEYNREISEDLYITLWQNDWPIGVRVPL